MRTSVGIVRRHDLLVFDSAFGVIKQIHERDMASSSS
jgi:hypothetical protein